MKFRHSLKHNHWQVLGKFSIKAIAMMDGLFLGLLIWECVNE